MRHSEVRGRLHQELKLALGLPFEAQMSGILNLHTMDYLTPVNCLAVQLKHSSRYFD